ncbi:hypothetical protein FVO59_11945 [Microbacterium esteraromaticum]|uniref:DUF4355 domain-containing protein n=1 Tax=Microbacterium esteraromaticum TaxID=57043 RepID=A0A7D7WF19_9MICO|nr:hypothetical protein [Microbacterium esteraromaticum]QMU97837.1 hypothetical protein FVO59_11945 [Microbacterium esteraromaticum]
MSKQDAPKRVLGAGFAPSWHRPHFRYFAPVEGEGAGGEGNGAGDGKPGEGKLFTPEQQAEVNRIVQERVQRVETKYADYNDLKKAADGAKTVEQKLADLESKHAEAEARALRSDIATKHGISAEDRDLFLTGSDEAALEAQAKRLAERLADQKKNGNRAPKEGGTTTTDDGKKDIRSFAKNLFAAAQNE